jgi:hypothetical protein
MHALNSAWEPFRRLCQSSIFLFSDWTKAYHMSVRKTSCLLHCPGMGAVEWVQCACASTWSSKVHFIKLFLLNINGIPFIKFWFQSSLQYNRWITHALTLIYYITKHLLLRPRESSVFCGPATAHYYTRSQWISDNYVTHSRLWFNQE